MFRELVSMAMLARALAIGALVAAAFLTGVVALAATYAS
jgi:hypothetical protein